MKPLYSVFETLVKQRGLTAYRVSQDLGFTSVLFSDWKKGKSCPKADKILLIADYFGVSVDYFYKGNEADAQTIESAKVAVFGADVEVTDEEWDEIRQYAQFIKQRKTAKKSGEKK